MNHTIKIIIFIFATHQANAQTTFCISPAIGFGQTSIYNTEDVKGKIHVPGFENPLPMQATFASNFGLDIGLYWVKQKTSLQSITVGIGSMLTKQNYNYIGYNTPVRIGTGKAYTNLNYLSVPILASVRIGNIKKFVPTIALGINYLYLQNYTDYISSTNTELATGISNSSSTIVKNNLSEQTSLFTIPTKYNDWMYIKNIFCSFVKLGCDYQINKKMKLNASIYNIYSLNNPENRNLIIGINPASGETQFFPYQEYIHKTYNRGSIPVRPTTHIINTGLQLQFTYLFFSK
jgi:hypothetical protein